MGSIYGAAAHDNGHEVHFVDVVPEVVDAINERGLIIDRRDGQRAIYRIPATTDPDAVGATADVILFQIKGWATAAAASSSRCLVRPGTVVVTLQNGLGNEEVLRAAYPANPIAIGMSVHTVVTQEVAHYAHTGVRDTHLGPTTQDQFDRATFAASAFAHADFPVEVLPERDIRTAQWGKFVLNCGSLPVAALTRLATDQLRETPEAVEIIDALTRETCAIGQAAGYELDADERVAFGHDLLRTAGGRASMLGDILAHRRTEIDTINGAALRYAERYSVDAPLNRTVFGLVKGLERTLGLADAGT